MYDDPMIPIDEAMDPDKGWGSRAAVEWFDVGVEFDELDGFQIVERP